MVMQSAEDRQGYNSSGRMDGSGDRSVLDKGQMRSSDVVVFRIRAEHMAQMSLPEDEDVIKALPSDRADQPFDMAVLPRRRIVIRPALLIAREQLEEHSGWCHIE